MNLARKDNLLDDSDVRRYCLQLDNGSGLPVPDLIFDQAFRPVSTTSVFGTGIYTGSGGLQRSQFTNNRLIGRSRP